MLFLLIAGHALADYPLQNGAMATCKDRHARLPLQKAVPWYYWLTAHALVHGLVVTVLIAWWTGQKEAAVLYGVAEFVVHWWIDFMKCEGWTGILADQLLHVACKVVWWALLTYGTFTLSF